MGKVTNFQISERLSELGFNCDSHSGWWLYNSETLKYGAERPRYKDVHDIKAYDSWDLLMWLRKHRNLVNFYIGLDGFVLDSAYKNYPRDASPQNALGLAIIKILEAKRWA